MRNLTLRAVSAADLRNASVVATAVDVDENVVYAASEQQDPDGNVHVEIWNVGDDKTQPTVFAMFSAVFSPGAPQVVSFRVLPEVEVEGTVEPCISAASWSPDESLLAVVTGDDKLILMTATFDVLSEAPIHTIEFGDDAPINVGWGSKQTQFHGSLGKAAAQAPAQTLVGSSPDDDSAPRISWRGDGAFFVVSSLSPPSPTSSVRRRTLRVYDRDGKLQSTSEAVPGLEHTLGWRPSGNLIAGTQRFGYEGGGAGTEGRHDVVFFERNGLRHGEFGIRAVDLAGKGKEVSKWGYRIRELSWSSDSSVLAIWIERDEGDFNSGLWAIITATYIQRTYSWDTFTSPSTPPIDTGAVAVFDGTKILLTPFRIQNVPPPMSSAQIPLSSHRSPIHASFSAASDTLAVLWESGFVELWALRTRLHGGRGKAVDPARAWSGSLEGVKNAREIRLVCSGGQRDSSTISVLWTDYRKDYVTSLQIEGTTAKESTTTALPSVNSRFVGGGRDVTCQGPSGEIHQCKLTTSPTTFAPSDAMTTDDPAQQLFLPVANLHEFCVQSQGVPLPPSPDAADPQTVYIGLGSSGKLHISSGETHHVLATNATSFTVASGYIIYTTTAHDARFVPVASLRGLLAASQGADDAKPGDAQAEWETRRVERGARIVVAVPSAMALVLQMPRGNLETINPRPLVMEVVKQDIDAGEYRKAFFACRKHRIDLNVLVEHDEAGFLERISSFVEQISEVDHINLFLSNLGRGSQPAENIARLCDAVRVELERKDLKRYVNSILTAYVVKSPPEHEAGLSLLLRLRESDPEVVEDAVKYIIFLVDADRLFDTALGMYDFSLVLMIAQHAQKDPREYLPFLRELRALEKYYQRFKIDDHLKRYESALRNLGLAGAERFEEAMAYIELHALYDAALKIWRGTDRYNPVLVLYGDWLFERREFRQAASVFLEAQNFSKAMVAHEKALEWQELFYLASHTGMSEEEMIATGYRVAEDLTSKKRHSEAARVLLDYAKDIREAIIAYVQGNHFSEARRIIALQRKPELMEDVVHPAALESCNQITEDINECLDQLRKQLNRIRELRIRKVQEPGEILFSLSQDVALHNVDVMTDVSMAPTAFTRYTVAPTTTSRSSRRTSRSKRKMERKVGSGRKGTVDEEEYLLKSLTKLAARFVTIQGMIIHAFGEVSTSTRDDLDEARNLLPHLLQFTPDHRKEGVGMQKHLADFGNELQSSLNEVWTKPEEETPIDSWATRMEQLEKDRRANPVDKVPKPELSSGNKQRWQMNLFDVVS
ncbi:hypothetical protein C0992_008296 [Termitomyces sp. T32_za158]|nr:hypothetical protein C0992_008296 [Termitomyces sp. T32_za158]